MDELRTMWTNEESSRLDFATEEISKIVYYRRARHADLPRVCQMMRTINYDLFGDVEPGRMFEMACLSLVQINEKQEVVSNVNLCNFPNVPAIPMQDWLSWLTMHYEMPGVTERNTLFIHLLVWDCRYEDVFLDSLLENIFAITSYCLHVVVVAPPGLSKNLVEFLDNRMTRVGPKGEPNNDRVQTIYVSFRNQRYPKLQIRRIVEEDNDDLIPIIDAESTRLREHYGDFYISEITRFPGNGNRQFIVSESDSIATGVMCLNEIVDVDLLNEIFELGPYNGLRKSARNDEIISRSSGDDATTVNKTASEDLSPEVAKNRDKERFSLAIARIVRPGDNSNDENYSEDSSEAEMNYSEGTSIRQSGIEFSIDFANKLRTSVFAEAINEVPVRSLASFSYNTEDDDDDDDDDDVDVDLASSQPNENMDRESSSHPSKGDLNAFTIELFSMDKKIDEQHGGDYLEAAFECFPQLEYCVMLLPSTQPFFPFLENFARVPLRFDKDFPMVLYVAHRATLLGFLHSREAIIDDRPEIEDFLRGIPKKNAILDDFDDSINLENKKNECYLFMCENRLIGISILCGEPDVDQLKLNYNIEDYISMENTARDAHARLLHFILVPVFSGYHRFFFRELMRLSCTTAIYYRLYETETVAINRTRPLVTCLDAMINVESRIRIHRPWPMASENIDHANQNNFSLFVINPRLAMMPKRVINTKIVVVGASDCGLAFAEYLALQRSAENIVHFTNLTIVSPNGLPFERKETLEHSTMIPFKGRYCYAYRRVVPTRVWINVVQGTVSHINRKDKHVTVFGLGNLSYDYLVLTCGLRYHPPNFNRDASEADKRGISQREEETIPLNCFCINDDVDALTCLERLKELTEDWKAKKSIVLYGRNINCHCVLETLLKLGVPGAWILMIEPKLKPCEKRSDIFFENDEIDDEIARAIRDCGVTVLAEWDLKNWILENGDDVEIDRSDGSSVITSLRIQSKNEKKIVACDALIYFGEKTITTKTFMAISRAGLVFDGRLVIDPEYRTNDPHIFAAGSLTKYSGKYQYEHLQHDYYNSIEIGERLASNLKLKIDPESRENVKDDPMNLECERRRQTRLPVFRAPIVVYCILPGGYHYLHVRKPGKKVRKAVSIAAGIHGDVLVTGSASADSQIGYFRIRLNRYNTIETITCLSNKAFEVQHLITLYGKHDSMLNNLRIRFQNSLVSDLYQYFGEPWAAALFHDRFDALRVENRAILLSETAIHRNSLVIDATNAFVKSKWNEMSEEDRRYIEKRFQGSIYENAISSALVNFLQAEEELLPNYCNPRKLRRESIDEDVKLFPV